MKINKWTKEQEAFLLIKREDGISYSKISELMESKFGIKRKGNTIAAKYAGLTKTKKEPRKSLSWNTRKVDFVFSCLWNGLTTDRIKVAFEEEFDYKLSNTQLKNCLAKKKPSDKVQKLANKMLNPKPKVVNMRQEIPSRLKEVVEEIEEEVIEVTEDDWRNEPATRKQLRYLAGLMNPDTYGKDLSKLTKGMIGNYSKGEACDKIEQLVSINNSITQKNVVEVSEERPRNLIHLKTRIEEPTEPKERTLVYSKDVETVIETRENFNELTREQDLYLLINWHTMSIDEARDYFGMPYYILARRLY